MPKGIGPEDYILDEEGKDIAPRSKRRLSDYLSSRTRGGAESFTPPQQGAGDYTYMPPRPNTFPVQEGSTEIPADASRMSPGSFAPDLRPQISDPDLYEVVSTEPSANRSSNGGETGHVAVNSQRAKSAVEGVLASNRFTSKEKFTSQTFSQAVPRSPESFTGQGSKTGKNVFESMRKAALTSMLNAAGGVAGPGGGLVTMSDVDGANVEDFKVGLSGLPRIGVPGSFGGISDDLRVKTSALRPAADRSKIESGSTLSFEGSEPGDSEAADISPRVAFDQADIAGASETRYNSRTFGQLNSYLQNFSGIGTINSVILALVAYGVLFIASAIVSFVISVIVNRMPRPDSTTDVLPLGSERGAAFGRSLLSGIDTDSTFRVFLQGVGGLIAKILGVMQPYDGDVGILQYFLASVEGTSAILGIDTNDFTTAGNAIINIGTSPGYYLTLVREISRDLSLLSSRSETESGILGFLQGFRSSRLVKFVDVCARLGIVNGKARDADVSLDPDNSAGLIYPVGGDSNSPVGLLVNASKTAALRVSRSREANGSKRLAWSHTSVGYTRSELVTDGLIKSLGRQKILENGGTSTGLSGLRNLRARKVVSNTGRISNKDRIYHEQLLDSEYMPFYFHDVRTNEILSFHAFLSSLSDSYNANYNSVDGFGRMDPIQIYKNTTRSISFSFVVVATSPDDHSQMWYSVNKLVNMIYPQWSEGDRIDVGNNSYIQPFSQTIAASPMVRVRIGDVIHSNYSRFALERIFGLELEGSKLESAAGAAGPQAFNLYKGRFDKLTPDGDWESISKSTAQLPESEQSTKALQVKNDPNNLNAVSTNTLVSNDLLSILIATFSVGQPVEIIPGRYKFYEKDPRLSGSSGNKERVDKSLDGAVVGYSEGNKIFSKKNTANIIVKLDNTFKKEKAFGRTLEFNYVEVSHEQLKEQGTVLQPLPSGVTFTQNIAYEDSTVFLVDEFLEPENNPIVKSFEQGSGGRGLAGFIQSLSLEYGDTENTWTVNKGNRAPNMVRINVSFLPIHDIPMGLSSDGTARSVAYPIGDVARKRHFPDLVQNDINMTTALSKK